MPSAETGAGLRYQSRWALLQEKLLDLISGHTTRGSSTPITCSRLDPICLYVTSLKCPFQKTEVASNLFTAPLMFTGKHYSKKH